MRRRKKKNTQTEYDFSAKEIKKSHSLNDDYKMVLSFLVVLLVIALVIIFFYLFNGKYVTKDIFKNDNTETEEVEYDETVLSVSDVFKVKDKEYYVLFLDDKDSLSAIYNDLIFVYNSEEKPLYSVNMGSALNQKYYNKAASPNENPKNTNEITINGTTLMEFKDGKVVSYITESKEIVNKLT